jgi:hypothetical protein
MAHQNPERMPRKENFGDEGSHGRVLRRVDVPAHQNVDHVLKIRVVFRDAGGPLLTSPLAANFDPQGKILSPRG